LAGLLVGPALLHVRQVGLVRLVPRYRRGIHRVATGREPTTRAVPRIGDRRIEGKTGTRLVPVRAPVGNALTRRGVTAFGLSHRSGTNPAASNGASTCHGRSPLNTYSDCVCVPGATPGPRA